MKILKNISSAFVISAGLSFAMLHAAGEQMPPQEVAKRKMELRKAVAEQLAKDVPVNAKQTKN